MYSSPRERADAGRAARAAVPRNAHATFDPSGRQDCVQVLTADSAVQVQDLLPVRFGRMLATPLTFYRGSAAVMAADLRRGTPSCGLVTHLCGDAHLANFGVYTTPRRRFVFDITHFDETAPGPFEWDVKRLAASFEVAGRVRGDRKKARRAYVEACVREYRETIRDLASATTMATWDVHLDVERTILPRLKQARRRGKKVTSGIAARAHTANEVYPLRKLVTVVGGTARLASAVPFVTPVQGLAAPEREEMFSELEGLVAGYGRTLSPEYRHLLEHFRLVDAARKAVGVGSVGARTFLLLLDAGNGDDPLLLQARQAEASVLVRRRAAAAHQGRRVVEGQRLLEASADGFLGWHRVPVEGVGHRDYYVRQVRDGRYTADVESLTVEGVQIYAQTCGWTLAHAHARAGDRIAIAAYLGGGDVFDRAVADFAATYADTCEKDFAAFDAARAAGRVVAIPGI